MAEQEKSFKALQDDERLKKLQRRLKLNQIKGLNGSLRLLSSPQSSMSVISSIQGDSALSDVSYCSPSFNSSRAGSVITSSINFRKVLSNNLKIQRLVNPSTSSVMEQSLDSEKMNNDRAMMPPPSSSSLAVDFHKQKSSQLAKQRKHHHDSTQAIDSMTGTSPLPNYDGQASCGARNSDNSIRCETPSTEPNAAVNSGSPKEGNRSNETSKRNGRLFMNWIVRLNDHGQICIKGKLESGEHVRSKAVKKRLNATTVVSVMHHKYHLLGNIYDLKEELPEYIRGKFFNGFPTDWENVRQIWQSYVASGCSQRFRWPRPIADSDDDLLSDITDLPIFRSTKTETLPKTPLSTVPSNEFAAKTTTNRSRIDDVPEIDVSIASVQLTEVESSSVRAKMTEALQTSCKNSMEKTSQTLVDHSKSNNRLSSTNTLSKEELVSQKSANKIPKWKIDVIIDNLMDKNCSKEYIHKVIEAINCINELFTMSSTDNTQIIPDKAISVNNNDVEKVTGSRDKSNSKFQNTKQTARATSDCSSLSLASSSESEPELPPIKNTFMCRETTRLRNNKTTNCKSPETLKLQVSSIAQKNTPKRSDLMSNNLSDSNLVRETTPIRDSNHQKNRDYRATPSLSRVESPGKLSKKRRYNEKLIFDTTDSDTDIASQNNARTGLVNHSFPGTKAFRRILGPKHSSVSTEKIVNKGKGISGEVDSDISIIDSCIGPCQKTTAVNIEKRTHDSSKHNHQKETPNEKLQLANNECNDHVQTGTRLTKDPEKSLDTSNPNVTPELIANSCTVRLTKVNLDQHNASSNNNGTPSRSEKTASLRKRRKVVSGRENERLPDSDSENFSMRMSSRGRRILPRLDYWNGERVFLRDQKLVYSPGMPDATLSSANSTISKKLLTSPNKTTISEPTLPQATAKNSNRTPKVSKDSSQLETEHRNRSGSGNARILSEITENQGSTSHHSWTRNGRGGKKLVNKSPTNEKQSRRMTHRHGPSSSEEEATPVVTRRKRRKIY